MLLYYKFHESVFAPVPAREVYVQRGPGQGWPEQCPPLRQANAFGWDVLSNFDLVFLRDADGAWGLEAEQGLASDWGADEDDDPEAAVEEGQFQNAAWFWDPEQKLPHPISPEVYGEIRNQVKISSFLFLRTDPNEVLLVTGVPNRPRSYRAVSALIETDWYPASYPWHCVLELDPALERVEIARGEPICRLMPVRRDTYFARAMSPVAFTEYFEESQLWLAQHGRGVDEEGTVDIRRSYRQQTLPSRFVTDEGPSAGRPDSGPAASAAASSPAAPR